MRHDGVTGADPLDLRIEALDAAGLTRLLLYGTTVTRQHVAVQLREQKDEALLRLLVDTVRSAEAWMLRARCLEALATVAAQASKDEALRILDALFSDDDAHS